MKLLSSLNQAFLNLYIDVMVNYCCQTTGCVCPNRIDETIAYNLYQQDRKDNGNRAREYERNKCKPQGLITSRNGQTEWEFSIECWSANPVFPKPECTCNYTRAIEEFKKRFTEEIINTPTKDGNNETM